MRRAPTRETVEAESSARITRETDESENGDSGDTGGFSLYPSAPPGTGACDKILIKDACTGRWFWFLARPSRWRLTIQLIIKVVFAIAIVVIFRIAMNVSFEHGRTVGCEDCRERGTTPPPTVATVPEGGVCRRWIDEDGCPEAAAGQVQVRSSLHFLKLGDASNAIGAIGRAETYYREAITIGQAVGAPWARIAGRRLGLVQMPCGPWDADSLARISRDYQYNPLGDLIDVKQKQQAMTALSYYSGDIDNSHSAGTRAGVRAFQRDLLEPETGALSARQTVQLICAAAHIGNDIGSQNVLGIMYGAGLGVRQNTDLSLQWLEAAAQRGDADALWNLAVMYGTGTVRSSVSLCDVVQNGARADSYLKEAADLGHPAARRFLELYPLDALDPDPRWSRIKGDLNQSEALERVGRACNPNG